MRCLDGVQAARDETKIQMISGPGIAVQTVTLANHAKADAIETVAIMKVL